MTQGSNPSVILSIGTQIPPGTIEQDVAASVVQRIGLTKRWNKVLPNLYKKSGVLRRSSVLLGPPQDDPYLRQTFYQPPTEQAPLGPTTAARMDVYAREAGPLLNRACEIAIERANIAPERITHLITVSCTGFCAPGVDHSVFERFGLSPRTQRFHIGFMGCHAMINGLRVANSITLNDPESIALVGAVELCSIHQQYTEDPEQIVANSLFSDGAAAAVVANGTAATSNRVNGGWRILSTESFKIPFSSDMMSWKIDDHGFQMTLSTQVPKRIAEELRGPIDAWLAKIGKSITEINHWVVHPGGPRILDAVDEAMGLEETTLWASRKTLENYGNMSSPTIAFIMEEICNPTAEATHNKLDGFWMVLGFGPGLHAEAILLERV